LSKNDGNHQMFTENTEILVNGKYRNSSIIFPGNTEMGRSCLREIPKWVDLTTRS